MSTVGIIAEYNPFHNGHAYQIQKAKEITGASQVIIIMSGDYVQRGVPAVTDKYTRTAMALAGGADVVFELPSRYAIGSAEYFAMGAVACLTRSGIVDSLCFGSECGNLGILMEAARLLSKESQRFQSILKEHLKKGKTYPSARKTAILSCLGKMQDHRLESLLSSPNNILGIEYLKALLYYNSPIKPFTIKRTGSGYHNTSLSTISSAASLRNAYEKGMGLSALSSSMPDPVFSILKEAEHKTFPMNEDDFSIPLFYKLWQEPEQNLSIYSDVSEDLGKRIRNLFSGYTSYSQFAKALKSKQYTLTRINRSLLHILLNHKNYSLKGLSLENASPCLRLLGLKKDASWLLRGSASHLSVPVITKVSKGRERLSDRGRILLEEDICGSSLYQYMVYEKFKYKLIDDYRHGPVII